MKDIQIELSASQWYGLLRYLDPNSTPYSIVKNAIESNEAPLTTPLAKVTLSCNERDVAVLLGVARKFVPEAVPGIEIALENRPNKKSFSLIDLS